MTSSPEGPRRLNSVDQSPGLVHQLSSSDEKIALFRSLFRGREDVYPGRFESRKTGQSGYAPACANEWVRRICEKPRIKYAECHISERRPRCAFCRHRPGAAAWSAPSASLVA